MIIKDMQINNNRIKEAKLNGNIVYQLDIKAPKLSYIHIESSSNSEDAYPNDIIKITMTANEELSILPKVSINGKQAQVNKDETAQNYTYIATTLVTEDMKTGQVSFTISNYADAVGNVGLTKNTTTDNSKVYIKKQLKPSFVSIACTSGNNIADVGDQIWVYVTLPHGLTALPKIKINGYDVQVIKNQENNETITYVGILVVTRDMQDGKVNFEIYGYIDAEGNVGEIVTQPTNGTSVSIKKSIPKRNIEKGDNLFNKIIYVDIPNDISIEKEEYGDMLNCKAFAINVQFDLEDNFVNCNGKLATFGKTQNDDFISFITFFSKNKTQINQNWKQIYIKPDENANESDFIVTYVDKTSIIYPYLFVEE